MGNPYPADFLEPDGSVRLGGAINFTDQSNQPGGGSQPGIGDYLTADTSESVTVPNNGTPTIVTFDDGVIAGGGGGVTLGVDNQTITVAQAGHYAVSVASTFDGSDDTGIRGVQITLVGNPDGATPESECPGAPISGTDTNDTTNWTGPLDAGATIKIKALVQGAADAVDLTYCLVNVILLAPVGA